MILQNRNLITFFFLNSKNIELKNLAQETQSLKDELDVLRDKSSRVHALEASGEALKKKLEEMSDFKKKVEELEENNTRYLEKIFLLEEVVNLVSEKHLIFMSFLLTQFHIQ